MQELPAVALVADDVALDRGPDAARAFHYFQGLRARGVDVHLVTREEHLASLCAALPGEEERIHGVPDPRSAYWLGRLGLLLPRRVRAIVTDVARNLVSQRALRRRVSQLVRQCGVRIVHQVTPERPGAPSRIQGLGVPVVMGPLREATPLPPGLRPLPSAAQRAAAALAGPLRFLGHRILSGRRHADVLLVANARSSRAVPGSARGRKLRLSCDAIELSEWKARGDAPNRDVPEFLFVGRLADDCGVDFLLDAFRLTLDAGPARLRIVGDGPLADEVDRRIGALDLRSHVERQGWLAPNARRQAIESADVLVSPSLRGEEGDTLMHAMATGLPVVAADWGCAADLASDGVGLLVGPRTPMQFTHELARLMHRLADTSELRTELGARARDHARCAFDWSQRIDRLLDVYRLVA